MKIARPIYRRLGKDGKPIKYVAVKPIRINSKKIIQPGKKVELRQHHMRSLYQRRRIGPKGHPWTEQAMGSKKHPLPYATDKPRAEGAAKVEDQAPDIQLPEPVKDDRPWAVDGQRFKTKGEATAWAEENHPDEDGRPEAEKDGLIWTVPDRDERFAKKAEAAAWIKENAAEFQPQGGE